MQLVGQSVQPGRYTTSGFEFCYWARLAGLSGEAGDVIVNDTPTGRAVVEILPSDVAFDSGDCGTWTGYVPGGIATTFGDGDWVVGQDIAPGQYSADATGGTCYWERASGFTHEFGELITNDLPSGRPIVEIQPSDVRFTSRDCGTWTPL
jgi:hypothetical protein